MSVIITVCNTCKREGWSPETHEKTDGEALAELVNHAAIGKNNLSIREFSCLMGCDFACNVTLQAGGKINYALGMFEPTREDAEAIVEYADKYDQSETGQVPYKTWPQGIKGHFRARVYPADAE